MMTIKLSEEAAEQLENILNYLEERWSIRTRNNFIDKLEDSFDSIITFPTGYPKSEKFPIYVNALSILKLSPSIASAQIISKSYLSSMPAKINNSLRKIFTKTKTLKSISSVRT